METLKIKLGTRTIEIDLYEAGERVTNPFTGKSAYLKPIALSLYDWIMGVQMLVTHPLASTQKLLIIASFEPGKPDIFTLFDVEETTRLFDEATDYFRSKWPKEYMVLLD